MAEVAERQREASVRILHEPFVRGVDWLVLLCEQRAGQRPAQQERDCDELFQTPDLNRARQLIAQYGSLEGVLEHGAEEVLLVLEPCVDRADQPRA